MSAPMFDVHLSRNRGWHWNQSDDVINNTISTKGYLFSNKSAYCKENDLNSYFENVNNSDDFEKKMQQANGFFSVIMQTENTIFAAVDRIRSMPLYYAQSDTHFYLSDCAEYIREKIGDNAMSPVSRDEYQQTGYVTGAETLFPNIKQLQAGEMLLFNKHTNELIPSRYFLLQRSDFSQSSNEELIDQLDAVHIRVFSRLLKSIEGRPILLPLSGGYDSRLIACMISRLGYKNVICFTYGKKGNQEAITSEKVARHLGFEWHYVEYSHEKWRNWYASNAFNDFINYSQMHGSLPFIQDWPALLSLVEQGVIPDDAVVVPGHSYDFLAGTHVVPEFFQQPSTAESLREAIYKYHYGLWSMSKKHKKKRFDHKHSWLDKLNIHNPESIACAGELWDWQERQAKFICNATRAYEFFDLEWRLPCWEKEMIEFWLHINIDKRTNRQLYLQYAAKYQTDINQVLELNPIASKAKKQAPGIINKLLKPIITSSVGVWLKQMIAYNSKYYNWVLQININMPFLQHFAWFFLGAREIKGSISRALLQKMDQEIKA